MNEQQELMTDLFKEAILAYGEDKDLNPVDTEGIYTILVIFLGPNELSRVQVDQLSSAIEAIEHLPTEECTLLVLRFIESKIKEEFGEEERITATSLDEFPRVKNFLTIAQGIVREIKQNMIASYSVRNH